jgi:polyribonucleotide nucleotidyltransferase
MDSCGKQSMLSNKKMATNEVDMDSQSEKCESVCKAYIANGLKIFKGLLAQRKKLNDALNCQRAAELRKRQSENKNIFVIYHEAKPLNLQSFSTLEKAQERLQKIQVILGLTNLTIVETKPSEITLYTCIIDKKPLLPQEGWLILSTFGVEASKIL